MKRRKFLQGLLGTAVAGPAIAKTLEASPMEESGMGLAPVKQEGTIVTYDECPRKLYPGIKALWEENYRLSKGFSGIHGLFGGPGT